MINSFRRIIQRMGHLWDMYKITRWVDEEIKGHNKANPDVIKLNQLFVVSADGVRDTYIKENKTKKDTDEVMYLIDSCIAEQFLNETMHNNNKWLSINPGNGRRFLRGKAYWPSGFFKEVAKDNFVLLSIVSGFLGGLIPMIIYIISRRK